MRVVFIVNNADIHRVVSQALQSGWPEAQVASITQGTQAVDMVRRMLPDIVLMDVSFPDVDGFEVLSRIREVTSTPVIVVTAKDAEVDRIRGLELGADDYVVAPVSPLELVARIRAVLRRCKPRKPAIAGTIENGGLMIDFKSEQVKLNGAEVTLTPIEFRLLQELASSTGQTVSQESLLARVWGEEYLDTPNLLKVHIYRLRRKLGDHADNPRIIATVPRRGYQLIASAKTVSPGTPPPSPPTPGDAR